MYNKNVEIFSGKVIELGVSFTLEEVFLLLLSANMLYALA
jgi:hypothetical protein